MSQVRPHRERMNQDALAIFTRYLETQQLPASVSIDTASQCLAVGEYYNSSEFMRCLISHHIKPHMKPDRVVTFLVESMKMDKSRDTYSNWMDLFSFCLNYMSEHLDKLCNEESTNQRLMALLDSKPLVLETIIEKGMKRCVESNYQNKSLQNACLNLLKRLRSPPTSSLLYLINLEQKRKISTVSILENQMIKWRITDQIDLLQCVSDEVVINNYRFVFYAERSSQQYNGLKIFTMLVSKPHKEHIRQRATLLDKKTRVQESLKKEQNNSSRDIQSLVCHCLAINEESPALANQKNKNSTNIKADSSSFHCCEANQKVEIAHLEGVEGSEDSKIIKIYQKVDFIQTLVMKELKDQNESPLGEKNLTNLVKIGAWHPTGSLRAQSHDFENPKLGRNKNLNLDNDFNKNRISLFTRDFQEPELYFQSLYKSEKRSKKKHSAYFSKKNSCKATRRDYSSFTNSLGRDRKTRIKKMSLMLNPHSFGERFKIDPEEEKSIPVSLQNTLSSRAERETLGRHINEASKFRLINCQSISSSKSSIFDEQMGNAPYEYGPESSDEKENINTEDQISMLQYMLEEKNKEIINLKKQIQPRKQLFSDTITNCRDGFENTKESKVLITRDMMEGGTYDKLDNHSVRGENCNKFFSGHNNPLSMLDLNSRWSFSINN
ncbi:unnamed protein product [Moneuplotes crassus]|uniref:Uncharacterized protein n=1 Tax=Euplotes crassus TaxID=5936 RepID=A0AAD1U7J8_EUPCR|nr:unnamed protein product [Moneuplotes crassus]